MNQNKGEADSFLICGIDEAGRGPLAGPVYAAAVILNNNFPHDLLADSKKINAVHRSMARDIIIEKAYAWGIGWSSHTEIDSINILQASLLAMKRAFDNMIERNSVKNIPALIENLKVIVDGKFIPNITTEKNYIKTVKQCIAQVKADALVPEVMAASILAKTERDIHMEQMAELYPLYGYEKHKGYPTKAHREAVLKYGPSPIQRLSFRY